MTKLRSVAGTALLALTLGTTAAQGVGSDPDRMGGGILYELSQGGIPLGEVRVAVERTDDGFESNSSVSLPGLLELEDVLLAGEDGAAVSYSLAGTVQGVAISLDGTFTEDGASFELTQGGQEAVFDLPSEEPLYVVDNNFIDGFQVIAYVVLERGEPLEGAAVVPQAGALGRIVAQLRDTKEPVEVGNRTVEATGLDVVLTVGPQSIAAVAWLDDSGTIVALDQPLGNVRFTMVEEADAGDPGDDLSVDPDAAAEVTAAEVLERTSACVETREVQVASTGETLAGVLTLPVARPAAGAPTLLLLPGSGAVDVEGNAAPLIGNSGYRQLAQLLACHGYGVLRVAKLGLPPSTGDGNAVTLKTYAENTGDWLAMLASTDGVDPSRLGLIGHSEGGLVAMYAVAEGYATPDTVVLIAAAGRPLGVVLREQVLASARRAGAPEPIVEQYAADVDELLEAVRQVDGVALEITEELADNQVAPAFANAAGLLRSEIDVDPLELAARIDVPVLVVQGLKDVQILEVDGEMLAGALPDVLHLELADLTHNLVETPLPAEAMLLPGRDSPVSETMAAAIATFLHGTLKLAR